MIAGQLVRPEAAAGHRSASQRAWATEPSDSGMGSRAPGGGAGAGLAGPVGCHRCMGSQHLQALGQGHPRPSPPGRLGRPLLRTLLCCASGNGMATHPAVAAGVPPKIRGQPVSKCNGVRPCLHLPRTCLHLPRTSPTQEGRTARSWILPVEWPGAPRAAEGIRGQLLRTLFL